MHKPDRAEERHRIVAKWTGIPASVVKKMGSNTQYFAALPNGFDEHEKYLRPWNELMIKAGSIDRLVDFRRYSLSLK
jgi:hypothetical protein